MSPAALLVLSMWQMARRSALCPVLGAVAAVCVLTCSGCGTTTSAGLAAAGAVAKPLSCMAARAWLRNVCGEHVGSCPAAEDTSGGEAP